MIPLRVALGVNRLLATFVDAGMSVPISGTGFWLESAPEKKKLFVTNKHNVDPRLHRDLFHAKTARLAIELRTDPDGENVEVRQFEILDMDRSLFVSADADCAVFVDPHLDGFAQPFEISTMASEHHLASDGHDVWRWLDIGDATTFIGFAGKGPSAWWDRKRSYPIGRPAALASFPGATFEHTDIKTADTALVSGLSFSGASGSPVISHVKVDVSVDFSSAHFDNRVDSAILGIMSGHFWERGDSTPELFQHSGLSYFTRAPSITSLIERAREAGFVNATPHPFLARP